MKVFLTGATGFIGRSIIPRLVDHGHTVLALSRNDASDKLLQSLVAEPFRGSLGDSSSLAAGASQSDAVLHCGYNHDFTRKEEAAQMNADAVKAMCDALEGTGKSFIMASAFMWPFPSFPGEETAPLVPGTAFTPRGESDLAALEYVSKGVRVVIVRLASSVHGDGDQAFIPMLIAAARQAGASDYAGDGSNMWSATHVHDAADLFVAALESDNVKPGDTLHGHGEELPVKDLALAIGEKLGLPTKSVSVEEMSKRAGFPGAVMGWDLKISTTITKEKTGWKPKGPGLVEDIKHGQYIQ